MYATGAVTCPVQMLKLIIKKSNESAFAFFNKYKYESACRPIGTSACLINSFCKPF